MNKKKYALASLATLIMYVAVYIILRITGPKSTNITNDGKQIQVYVLWKYHPVSQPEGELYIPDNTARIINGALFFIYYPLIQIERIALNNYHEKFISYSDKGYVFTD